MAAYTEIILDKLTKEEMIGITLYLPIKVEAYNSANTDALEEIRKFNKNFVMLESEINILKKINTLLNKTIVDMERQCWVNAQYSKKGCLEVTGVSRDVSNEDLESKVLEVFNKVGDEISSRDIEACHHTGCSSLKLKVYMI